AFAVLMNSLTAASDGSSKNGLSFLGASTFCAICSSALAAFAMTSLQAAPGLGIGPRAGIHNFGCLSYPACSYTWCTRWCKSFVEDNTREFSFNAKGVSIPAAVSVFPGEQYQAPRSWIGRAYPNLIYYNQVDKGGHL